MRTSLSTGKGIIICAMATWAISNINAAMSDFLRFFILLIKKICL